MTENCRDRCSGRGQQQCCEQQTHADPEHRAELDRHPETPVVEFPDSALPQRQDLLADELEVLLAASKSPPV